MGLVWHQTSPFCASVITPGREISLAVQDTATRLWAKYQTDAGQSVQKVLRPLVRYRIELDMSAFSLVLHRLQGNLSSLSDP